MWRKLKLAVNVIVLLSVRKLFSLVGLVTGMNERAITLAVEEKEEDIQRYRDR